MSTTQLSVIPNLDLLSFADSLSATETPPRFASSNWQVLNANTSNSGYANGFSFNKQADDQLIYWPSAFLAIPYVIAGNKRSTTVIADDESTLGNPLFVGFKAPGVLSIVDRVSLTLGGATVSETNDKLSRYMYLKFLMSVSENWFRQNGPALFMGSELPEKEVLATRSNIATANTGINVWSNVTLTPSATIATSLVPADGALTVAGNVYNANRAFMSRCVNISRPGCRNMGAITTSANLDSAINARSPFILPTGYANSTDVADGSVYLSGYAMVPLVWVHDLFRELKLARGVAFNMTIFVNSCYSVVPSAGGESMGDNSEASFATPDRSCPIMVSTAGCTASSGTALDAPAIRGLGNVNSIGITFGSHSLQVGGGIECQAGTKQRLVPNSSAYVELWYQSVKLTEAQNNEWLANPPKSLLFSDFVNGDPLTFVIQPGAKFDYPVGQKLSPKRLIFTLHANQTVTNNNVPVHQGCISSDGYLSTPGLSIRGLQVSLDGQKVYEQTIDYDYLHYQSSFKPNLGGTACNANVSYAQGIYSKAAWDVSPIYVVPLDNWAVSGTSPRIVISATNSSSIPITIACYVELLKQVDVEVTPTLYKITSPADSI